MKKKILQAANNIKSIPSNMMAPTPGSDKKRRNISLGIGCFGLSLKFAIGFFPDVFPEGICNLAGELFYMGLAGIFGAGFFQNRRVKP